MVVGAGMREQDVEKNKRQLEEIRKDVKNWNKDRMETDQHL